MSVRFINQTIEDIMWYVLNERQRGFADLTREYLDRSGQHLYTISKQNVRDILLEGIVKLNTPNLTDPSQLAGLNYIALITYFGMDTNFFNDVFKILIQKIKNAKVISIIEPSTENEIQVLSSINKASIVKSKIFDSFQAAFNLPEYQDELKHIRNQLLEKNTVTLFMKGGEAIKGSRLSQIKMGTDFAHSNITVGKAQASIILGNLKEPFFNSNSKKAAYDLLSKAITEVVTDHATIAWVADDKPTERRFKLKSEIAGTFVNSLRNKGGDLAFDWKNLRVSIANRLTELAKEVANNKSEIIVGLATGEGSQPFSERLLAHIVNTSIERIKPNKKVKKKLVKEEKPQNKQSKTKVNGPKKQTKFIKAAKTRTIATKINKVQKPKSKGPAINIRALKEQINSRLSKVVKRNMQAPRLVNRTGRFATSANVTNVVQTPQGFPSISFSYMKYPYQTFEPGFAQGDQDRDPRKVIDQSIREIARELIVGRFYTRRV